MAIPKPKKIQKQKLFDIINKRYLNKNHVKYKHLKWNQRKCISETIQKLPFERKLWKAWLKD